MSSGQRAKEGRLAKNVYSAPLQGRALSEGNRERINYLKERYAAMDGRTYYDDYSVTRSSGTLKGIRL